MCFIHQSLSFVKFRKLTKTYQTYHQTYHHPTYAVWLFQKTLGDIINGYMAKLIIESIGKISTRFRVRRIAGEIFFVTGSTNRDPDLPMAVARLHLIREKLWGTPIGPALVYASGKDFAPDSPLKHFRPDEVMAAGLLEAVFSAVVQADQTPVETRPYLGIDADEWGALLTIQHRLNKLRLNRSFVPVK